MKHNVGGMKSKRIERTELSSYKQLARGIPLQEPLTPLCFIPRVMLSCFFSQILKLI